MAVDAFAGVIIIKITHILDISKMQRVKAHNLRKKDESKLVEDLTKHRVSISGSGIFRWDSMMW